MSSIMQLVMMLKKNNIVVTRNIPQFKLAELQNSSKYSYLQSWGLSTGMLGILPRHDINVEPRNQGIVMIKHTSKKLSYHSSRVAKTTKPVKYMSLAAGLP